MHPQGRICGAGKSKVSCRAHQYTHHRLCDGLLLSISLKQ
jgi:hypothetical protein